MRYITLIALIVALFFTNGCTSTQQMAADAQAVEEAVGKGMRAADDVLAEKADDIYDGLAPVRKVIEDKAYQGIDAGIKTADNIDTSLSIQATCATVTLKGNTFNLECVVINPVTNRSDETPPMYFIVDGKFIQANSEWQELDNGNVYTVITVPDNATGLVFAGKVHFVGKFFLSWNIIDGSTTNYGGWLKATN